MCGYACEILAPAGRVSDIVPLIESGADAIYVGLSGYSARPQSSDFTAAEIEQSLEIVHCYGKKLYTAVNANVPDESLPGLYEEITRLDALGADAFIISDYGLMDRVSKILRSAQLHASTLSGTYNYEDVRLLKEMGVKRVILSSDLYLDEITDIIDHVTDMDYEIVADGGICFNSNRQCLLPHVGQKDGFNVYCQKTYRLMRDGMDAGPAARIGNCPGKIHRTMGIYLGMGIVSFKVEGRTNSLDYILQRVRDAAESKAFYLAHAEEIPGMMHYIRRGYRIGGMR